MLDRVVDVQVVSSWQHPATDALRSRAAVVPP
jgi:hypothetical protein